MFPGGIFADNTFWSSEHKKPLKTQSAHPPNSRLKSRECGGWIFQYGAGALLSPVLFSIHFVLWRRPPIMMWVEKCPGFSMLPGIFCDYSIFVVSTFIPLTVSSPSTGITMQLRPSIFLTSGVPVSFVFTLTVTVGVFNSNVLVSERFS